MRQPAVYLVGAGPGDPGLMTVRGLTCLRTSDVVVHDHHVTRQLLRQVRSDAELIDVGSGSSQPMAPEAISYLIADKAREGRLVTRLKWGDPFVFDRGGEEALLLHEQGIPFEVIPGIPAAIGVPAYAGVPVSYPGGGDTITLLRGYEDESRTLPDIDWASLAKLDGTIVCYAGPHQLTHILEALLGGGWAADGEAVVVYDGTLPTQECLGGTLHELLEGARRHPRRAPAVLVVGRVTGFREHLRWFDSRPLSGRRVLVTRPREQAVELVERLMALGADVVEAPLIRIVPPDDPTPLLQAAADAGRFDSIVFASVNAVDAFMSALHDTGRDVRALKGPALCVVGSATADRLAHYGIRADLVPDEFRAEAVVSALARSGRIEGTSVLLPRSDIGREILTEELRRSGAMVTEVIAYRTVDNDALRDDDPDVYRMLLEGHIDAVTFTSPSAVRTFGKLYGVDQAADLLSHTAVATIGPVTADAIVRLGAVAAIQPKTYTADALANAIAAHFWSTKDAKNVVRPSRPSW